LTAPCEEKIWTTLRPELGEDEGKKALIMRALYGVKVLEPPSTGIFLTA